MKKVNFYDAYNKIKAKLVESNNTDGLETLKRFINQDKDLSKQFMLTSYVQTLKESDEPNPASQKILKEYCSKINVQNKKVIQLLEYFNINPADVEISEMGRSIDNVIRFENGDVVDLRVIKESLDYVTTPLTEEEKEAEENLTRMESLCISLKESRSKKNYNHVAKRVKLLSEKVNDNIAKDLITESIQTLVIEDKKDWESKCINLFEVYRETKTLLEGQYGGEGKLKFTKNVGIFHDIRLIADDDKNNPEYLILWVSVDVTPFNKVTANEESQNELKQIKKDYVSTLRKGIFRYVREMGIYDNDSIHTDTADNIAELKVRKKPLKLSTQIFLNIKKSQDEGKPVAMDKYFPALIKILAKVSKEIQDQVPQLDPAMHKKQQPA